MLYLNRLPVRALDLHMPPVGNWYMELEVSNPDMLEQPSRCVLSDDADPLLVGSVVTQTAGSSEGGLYRMTIVGGSGALGKAVTARYYQAAPLSLILSDMLTELSEAPDPDPGFGIMDTADRYLRASGTLKSALATFCRSMGMGWRVTNEGLVLVDAFDYSPTPATYAVVGRHSSRRSTLLEVNALDIFPWTELSNGIRVNAINYFADGGSLMANVYEEGDA